MLKLANYEIQTVIAEKSDIAVYRGRALGDGRTVVVKANRDASARAAARLRHEFEITRELDFPGVSRVLEMTNHARGLALVMEDHGGESLKAKLGGEAWSTEEFLRLAVELARALGEIHSRNIIHRDVKPGNIVVGDDHHARFIDFGIASRVSLKTRHLGNPDSLEGTLAYISPEQTGRMNRVVDNRSDLYSLGVMFHEMLAGRHPFEGQDGLELVHSHLARVPPPLTEIRPDIPSPLAMVIAKLMAKNAEDRYQSAFGLQADLRECLRGDANGNFKPGLRDFSGKFTIPQKLYGRHEQLRVLSESFARAAGGAREIIFVAGRSGTGKSALVNEVHKPITEKRGFFISGKYNQFERNIPYSAVSRAFRDFCGILLTEEDETLNERRERVLEATGENARVLFDVIPNLELILGPQPEVPALGPRESENRLNLIFRKFVRAIARPEHPLVLFLDDLQWADGASLALLKALAGDVEAGYFMLIAAYRDNEVGDAHPFNLVMRELRESPVTVHDINLEGLSRENVEELAADALSCDRDRVRDLASLTHAKTGGNAFFTTEFLKSLYENQVLVFQHEEHRWQWDLDGIAGLNISDDVVELVARKLYRLPEAARNTVMLAACIGDEFALDVLARVSGKEAREVLDRIWPAVEEGLIVPLDESYRFLEDDGATTRFKFMHDRVQQAAYGLIPADRMRELHRDVGRILLRGRSEHEVRDDIFEITGHLNKAREMLSDARERLRLAELNLQATRRARAAAAYQPAYEFARIGISLLPENETDERRLAFSLYNDAAESAYLTARYADSEKYSGRALELAETRDETIDVYDIRIRAYSASYELQKGVDAAREALRLLGIKLPARANQLHVVKHLLRIKIAQRGRSVREIEALPEVEDERIRAAMRITSTAVDVAFFYSTELFVVLVFTIVELSMRYGNSRYSPYPYAGLGLSLVGVLGKFREGLEFGRLASNLVGSFHAKDQESRILFITEWYINHIGKHVKESRDPLEAGLRAGQESGDVLYAAYCVAGGTIGRFMAGEDLESMQRTFVGWERDHRERGLHLTQPMLASFAQATMNLRGTGANTALLKGALFDEDRAMDAMEKSRNEVSWCYANTARILLRFHFGEYDEVVQLASLKPKIDEIIMFVPLLYYHYWFLALALVARAREAKAKSPRRDLRRAERVCRKMEKWADFFPGNTRNKTLLIRAELARSRGENTRALELYEQALAVSLDNEFDHEAALVCEQAAEFCFSAGLGLPGRAYLSRARELYEDWGAHGKLHYLDGKFQDEDKKSGGEAGDGFQEFARELRRFARRRLEETGKPADIEIRDERNDESREKTPGRIPEAAREVLSRLIDNALVHGIETPEERKRKGKSPRGRILIRFSRDENGYALSCEDDGAGPDMAAIRSAAVSRGLIEEDAAVSETELRKLMFTPGVGTGESSRGMGLEVVRAIARSLGGRVALAIKPGASTRFTLRLPD